MYKEVRSLLELAVPVWHSALTKQQSKQIERIQKFALAIILEKDYTNHKVACTLLKVDPLYVRRETIYKFIKKKYCEQHPLVRTV